MNKKNKGHIFIISGPSGVGKTTIRKRLLASMPELRFSVSYTTRIKRKGETDGKDYFYITAEEFEQKIKEGFFAEWAKVYNHYYGTSKYFILDSINTGNNCLLDIDVQGCMQVKEKFPDSIAFFIVPPDLDELINRLKKRNTETEQDFQLRVNNARKELSYKDKYDYIIKNDFVDNAVEKLVNIIQSILEK